MLRWCQEIKNSVTTMAVQLESHSFPEGLHLFPGSFLFACLNFHLILLRSSPYFFPIRQACPLGYNQISAPSLQAGSHVVLSVTVITHPTLSPFIFTVILEYSQCSRIHFFNLSYLCRSLLCNWRLTGPFRFHLKRLRHLLDFNLRDTKLVQNSTLKKKHKREQTKAIHPSHSIVWKQIKGNKSHSCKAYYQFSDLIVCPWYRVGIKKCLHYQSSFLFCLQITPVTKCLVTLSQIFTKPGTAVLLTYHSSFSLFLHCALIWFWRCLCNTHL